MWLLTLQLFENSIDTQEKLRLNFHSLSVSELLEYGRKAPYVTKHFLFEGFLFLVLSRCFSWQRALFYSYSVYQFFACRTVKRAFCLTYTQASEMFSRKILFLSTLCWSIRTLVKYKIHTLNPKTPLLPLTPCVPGVPYSNEKIKLTSRICLKI
jgi:hypothetical protein